MKSPLCMKALHQTWTLTDMTVRQTLRYKTFMLTVVAVMLLSASTFGLAQDVTGERILSFHSDIDIAADGSMMVTETIRVRAEGDRIRRGLFREFPTRYSDGAGNTFRVEFEVLQLLRDGQTEPWSADLSRNGVRVDFGDGRLLQVPREYEYQLQYRTHRQIGFFESLKLKNKGHTNGAVAGMTDPCTVSLLEWDPVPVEQIYFQVPFLLF